MKVGVAERGGGLLKNDFTACNLTSRCPTGQEVSLQFPRCGQDSARLENMKPYSHRARTR